jgi:superfamily II DNA helicase RecQ
MAAGIVGELRTVTYKATGTLQRTLDPAARMSRGEFDGLLHAMVRAGLIELEDAEYEKDGEVRRYRKAMVTDAGLEPRAAERAELLIPDGVTEGLGRRGGAKSAKKKDAEKRAKTADAAAPLSAGDAELAARLRAWRAAEAKRMGVPTFMVLHERTLEAVAATRPGTPRELLGVKGMGEAKVEKFGAAILGICGAGLAK